MYLAVYIDRKEIHDIVSVLIHAQVAANSSE